jgi:hypothetical protein
MRQRSFHWPLISTSPDISRFVESMRLIDLERTGRFSTYRSQLHPIQVQVGGKILPVEAGASEPTSKKLVDFDGIAMFLYESPEVLTAMLSHPYYTEVVEPDEHVFIDKNAFGGGMVATFIGNHIEAVDRGEDVWVGDKITRRKYKKLFESYL